MNVLKLLERVERLPEAERRKAMPRIDRDLKRAVTQDMAEFAGEVVSTVALRGGRSAFIRVKSGATLDENGQYWQTGGDGQLMSKVILEADVARLGRLDLASACASVPYSRSKTLHFVGNAYFKNLAFRDFRLGKHTLIMV